MKDIAPELLEKMRKDFNKLFSESSLIAIITEKKKAGTLSFKDADDCAEEIGAIINEVFAKYLTEGNLPDGKLYYNIANRVMDPTLKDGYALSAEIAVDAQVIANKSAGIGLNAVTPAPNQDRIDGLVDIAAEAESVATAIALVDESVINFIMSAVTDTVEENAKFQADSGIPPIIKRTMTGNCCDWCRERAGMYQYGSNDFDPKVFQRHRYCRCLIEYVGFDGKVKGTRKK